MKLSIVVLVYNEHKTVRQAIDDVRSLDIEKEIIVVDNCSTDGTVEILKKLNYNDLQIIYQDKNYGVGQSYKTGLGMSQGEYLYIQFSDLEYDYTKCLEMLQLAESNKADAVFGSRLTGYLGFRAYLSLINKKPTFIASIVTTYLINKWYGYGLTDIIGSKLYNVNSLKKVIPMTRGMGFDFELVSRMCKSQYRIEEIAVDYTPRHNSKEKKIKPYHIINALWALLKVRIMN